MNSFVLSYKPGAQTGDRLTVTGTHVEAAESGHVSRR
jgi:hypothetical protein